MEDSGWRGVGVRKRARKCFQSIRCECEKGENYHKIFVSKAVADVFFIFFALGGTIECTVTGHKKYSDDLAQAQARA